MNDTPDPARPLGDDLARLVGPLAPSAALRERVLARVAAAPQEPAPRARRSWPLLATVGAAAVVGVILWLGSRFQGSPALDVPPTVAAPGEPWDEPPDVAQERAANEACWERARAGLAQDFPRSWVVIADGHVVVRLSAEEPPPRTRLLASLPKPPAHAFTFRVGEDGPREETFFSSWYAPRFAGPSLGTALGASWTLAAAGGSSVTMAGKPTRLGEGPVFPRFRIDLEGPARGSGERGARLENQEVFVGSLGPSLMLTPEDAVALDLFRWEVPGLVTVWGRVRCRQATVSVSVTGWDEPHRVTALWPIEPRAVLIGMARSRDAFWGWGGDLGALAIAGGPPAIGDTNPWILFGRDRVLARGIDPLRLLLSAEVDQEPTYHRFLMRWPREAPLVVAKDAFAGAEREERINGRAVRVRGLLPKDDGGGPAPLLVSAADAAALHLERAEEGRDLLWAQDQGEPLALRGGHALWMNAPSEPIRRMRAVLVVYVPPAPPPEPPAVPPEAPAPSVR